MTPSGLCAGFLQQLTPWRWRNEARVEVTGQKGQGWIWHPTAVALSVLPLSSSLRPLPGLELAEAGPAWIQGWRGASKAGSSQSPLWQEQRGEGVAHSDLAQVP